MAADDSILFVKVFMDQVGVLKSCLDFFYESFGEKVNFVKTSVFFYDVSW